MVKISVIIPTYNVAKFIKECLNSTINQTFEDMEIICIDDGSTDNTVDIIKDYALKDSRIQLYQNNENMGIAYVRNLSLTIAKGKYIYFLDSDDYIELDALEKLYNIAEEKSLDIIFFKIANFKNFTKREFINFYTEMNYLKRCMGNQVFNYNDVKLVFYEICVNLQGKLFKRDLIYNIKFPERLIFEDVPFFTEAFFKAKRVYFHHEYLCHKRDRRKSITTTYNRNYIDFIEIMDHTMLVTKKYNHYDELKEIFIQHMISANHIMMMRTYIHFRFSYYKKLKNYYINHKNEIEEVYDDIYLKYQLIYDICLISDNYLTFIIRLNYYYIINFRRVIKERHIERSMYSD